MERGNLPMDKTDEKVSLMMMPVCVCGYVFQDLRLEPEECDLALKTSIQTTFKSKKFFPYKCPGCDRIIENVRARSFNENDSSVVFITKFDIPQVEMFHPSKYRKE